MLTTNALFGNHFPVFEGGFIPWDPQESPLVFPFHDETVFSPLLPQEPAIFPSQPQEPAISPTQSLEPVISNSGLNNSNSTNQIIMDSSFGSSELILKHESSNSGSDETDQKTSIIDERKRKRMISNRESAKRSRMRKHNHLENLRNQVNQLRIENLELTNKLRAMTYGCQLLQNDNQQLQLESNILRQRLWDIRQVLYVRELQQQLRSSPWPCNTISPYINEEQTPQQLIT